MTEKEIRDLFKENGVELAKSDVWSVQQAMVIKHAALERLAASLKIVFGRPQILRCERDEAVILVEGYIEGKEGWPQWSIGEAVIGANYRVSGKQAAYVWAMAEKRAKDRVILKLANLHGAYSEDEADDFRQSAPSRAGADQAGGEASNRAVSSPAAPGDPFGLPPIDEPTESQTRLFADLKARFEECTSMAALDEKVKKAVPEIESLTDEQKDRLRKALRFVREALRPRVVS